MSKKAIITVIFIILTFTACKGSKAEVTDTELDDYIFNQIDFEYVSDISPSEGLFLKGDFLYFFMNGNETYPLESENSYHICKYNITDNELSVLFDIDSKEWSVQTFYVTEEGAITLLRNREFWDAESMTTKREVEKITYGEDGTQKESIMLGGDESPEIAGNIIDRGKFDNEGNVYIVYQNIGNDGSLIYKYSHKGEYKGRIELDGMLTGFAIDNEGNPVVSYYNESGNQKAVYLDFNNEKTSGTLKSLIGMTVFIDGYNDASFFADDSSILYKYNKQTDKMEPVLNWIKSSIESSGIIYIAPESDSKWLCVSSQRSGEKFMGMLEKSDGVVDSRKIIKVASAESNEGDRQMIIDYNRKSTKYRIEYISYSSKEDPQNALFMDILAGNVPDIIFLYGSNAERLAENGVLEDLGPYMKKDNTLNEGYFIDGILRATSVDGRQYYVTKSFGVETFVGRKSDIEDFADGYTVDELISRYKSEPEDKMLFPTNTIGWTADFLIYSNIDRYIDWDAGECSFDSDDFRKLLGFCSEFDDYDMSISSDYEYDLILNNQVLLNHEFIEDTAAVQAIDKLYKGDELYIGYPGDDCVAYLNTLSSDRFGIFSESENKEAAWEIIKELMEIPGDIDEGMFPASEAKFEEIIKRDMDTAEHVNEDGMIEGPRNEGVGLTGLTVGPATKEDISTLRMLIKSSGLVRHNQTVVDILRDDIEAYFDGKRSLDDTVDIIQDRMVKYVNENR